MPEWWNKLGTSNYDFAKYFVELKNSLSKVIRPTVCEIDLRVAEFTETEKGDVADEDFLRFVPIVYKYFQVIVLFHAEHNYLLGF